MDEQQTWLFIQPTPTESSWLQTAFCQESLEKGKDGKNLMTKLELLNSLYYEDFKKKISRRPN